MNAPAIPRLSVSATQRLMLRGLGLVVLIGALGATVASAPTPATAGAAGAPYTGTVGAPRAGDHAVVFDRGAPDLTQLEVQRVEFVLAAATRYGIPESLAALIYDTALREGIDPDLGFRLVRIESGFRPAVRSSAGAIGLAQVMPTTAVFYDRAITSARLTDPATNLRIGFRYLRDLLERYDWDLRIALLA